MLFFRKPVGTAAFLGGLPSTLTDFTRAWGKMVAVSQEYYVQKNQFLHIDDAANSHHATARNGLCQRMLGDFIWMSDTDHSFQSDIVIRMASLMEQANIESLSGVYQFKVPPYQPNVFRWIEDRKEYGYVSDFDWSQRLVGGVGVCTGGGCLMVRRSLLDKLRRAFAPCQPFDELTAYSGRPFGEDFSFSDRMRLLGIPHYVAPMIHSEHLMVKPVTLDMFQRNQIDPGTTMRIG